MATPFTQYALDEEERRRRARGGLPEPEMSMSDFGLPEQPPAPDTGFRTQGVDDMRQPGAPVPDPNAPRTQGVADMVAPDEPEPAADDVNEDEAAEPALHLDTEALAPIQRYAEMNKRQPTAAGDDFGGFQQQQQESPLATYASRTRAPQVEAPPQAGGDSTLDKIGWGIAGVLSLLTGGQDLPGIVTHMTQGNDGAAMENYTRRTQALKDQAQIDQTYAQAGTPKGSESPFDQYIRTENLKARLDELEERKRRNAIYEPGTAENASYRTFLDKHGVAKFDETEGWSKAQFTSLNPALTRAWESENVDKIQAVSNARAEGTVAPTVEKYNQTTPGAVNRAKQISDATQGNKLELAAANREGQQAQQRAFKDEDFGVKYAENASDELEIASLMENIDDKGGPTPTFLERMSDTIAGYGMSPDRLDVRSSKRMILEKWSRSQSGAAISNTEDGKFINQTANNKLASDSDISSAYRTLERVIQTRLTTRAAPNRTAATQVVESQIDPTRWLKFRTPASAGNGKVNGGRAAEPSPQDKKITRDEEADAIKRLGL